MSLRYLFLYILLGVLVSSCTTYSKTMYTAGTLGCAASGAAFHSIAPPPSSNKKMNALLGCAIGAGVSALVTHFLWNEDPTNSPIIPMKLNEDNEVPLIPEVKTLIQTTPISLSKLQILNVPKGFRGRLPTPKLIEHLVKPQVINGKFIIPEGLKIYEYDSGIED